MLFDLVDAVAVAGAAAVCILLACFALTWIMMHAVIALLVSLGVIWIVCTLVAVLRRLHVGEGSGLPYPH